MKKGLKAVFVLGTIFISFIVIMSAMFSGSDDTKASETTAVSDTSYRTEIASQSAQMTDIFTTLSTQMSNYSNTTEWKVDTAVAIQELRDLVDQANNMQDVPAEYKEVHEKYMQAMEQYEIVADELPTAIDNLDVNQMNELTTNMSQGNAYLTEATLELNNVN
ncbi:Protein of unknown function [Priestia aryabhattai B8W22]|uniref:DUF7018 domain-containing (lipo)protein n=1 Tax=Priestia aryabhattai TaxID=412384 RepID=UPI000889E9DB|nr:Protein of unknown function [Priestia aryabhattai B8W22]